MLRSVELAEHRALGVLSGDRLYRSDGTAQGGADGAAGHPTDDEYPPSPGPGGPGAAGPMGLAAAPSLADPLVGGVSSAALLGAGASSMRAVGGTDGTAELDALLYSELDLYCPSRKLTQLHLLRRKVRAVG